MNESETDLQILTNKHNVRETAELVERQQRQADKQTHSLM